MKTNEEIQNVSKSPSIKQIFIMIGVLVVCATAFITLSGMEDARLIDVSDKVNVVDNTNIKFDIGTVTMGRVIMFDNCYAGIFDERICSWDVDVLLQEVSGDATYAIPTYLVISEVAAANFDKQNDIYLRTGFAANVEASKLDLDNTDYKVLLYYNNNSKDVYLDTGKVLTKEGLVY